MCSIPKQKITILTTMTLVVTLGCDDRATQIAREAADRQAQQNTEMARLNKEVAAGSHELVEADARARKEIVGVHRDLQAERERLASSWDNLEYERQQIARDRRTESALSAGAQIAGAVIVTALLFGFCWYVLIAVRRNSDTDARLNELLVEELLADEPLTLSAEKQRASLPDRSASNHPLKG